MSTTGDKTSLTQGTIKLYRVISLCYGVAILLFMSHEIAAFWAFENIREPNPEESMPLMFGPRTPQTPVPGIVKFALQIPTPADLFPPPKGYGEGSEKKLLFRHFHINILIIFLTAMPFFIINNQLYKIRKMKSRQNAGAP